MCYLHDDAHWRGKNNPDKPIFTEKLMNLKNRLEEIKNGNSSVWSAKL